MFRCVLSWFRNNFSTFSKGRSICHICSKCRTSWEWAAFIRAALAEWKGEEGVCLGIATQKHHSFKNAEHLKAHYAHAALNGYSVSRSGTGEMSTTLCAGFLSGFWYQVLWMTWLLGWFQWSEFCMTRMFEPPLMQERLFCEVTGILYDFAFCKSLELVSLSGGQRSGPSEFSCWVVFLRMFI